MPLSYKALGWITLINNAWNFFHPLCLMSVSMTIKKKEDGIAVSKLL